MTKSVQRLADTDIGNIEHLLGRYGLELVQVANGETIPGSFWGDEEAGLIANRVYARNDTPIHSVMHETCHYICMDGNRRASLHTNAEGDYAEENGVCYLQIVLADDIEGMGRKRMMQDMDAWGYSFRLGSTQAWFEQDADDAREWLHRHHLIDMQGSSYKLRE